MTLKEEFNKAVNELLTDEQKAKFKEFAKKFKFDAPVIPPATPAVQPPAALAITPQPVSYPVDGGVPVFVDISDDGMPDIDPNDPVFSDAGLTTPYPDGDYKVTGTDFGFTVLGGIVTAVSDPDGKGAGTPSAAPSSTPAAPPQMPAMMSEMKAEFETKLAEASKIISELQTKFEAQVKESEDMKKDFSAFASAFSALLELPTAEPIKTPESKFAKTADKKFNKLTQFAKK